MAFIDGMICAEMTNWIGKLLLALYNAIGDFGWTVVVFAVVLRVILSPLDIWQKISSRKQAKKMERIRPQLEKLQRQYANDPQMLRQKQSELQKKEKIHMFTSCIPMIITLVLFFFIWDGFRALVSYENEVIVEKLLAIYNENVGKVDAATLNQMLVDGYDLHSFLWVKNIFMSDIGTNVIPSLEQYLSTGLCEVERLLCVAGAVHRDQLLDDQDAAIRQPNARADRHGGATKVAAGDDEGDELCDAADARRVRDHVQRRICALLLHQQRDGRARQHHVHPDLQANRKKERGERLCHRRFRR